jgi:drug/metabolite transporter (DMT)-like permease
LEQVSHAQWALSGAPSRPYIGAMTTTDEAIRAGGGTLARLGKARLAVVALFVGAFATSLSGIFIKLSELPPTATGFYRVFLSAPILLLWLFWERPRLGAIETPRGWRDHVELAVAGSLFGINTALWCWCMKYTSVANGQFIANVAPIFVSVGAFLFLRERFSRRFLQGLALTILGVGLLVGQSAGLGGGHLTGDVLALVASLFWSAYLLALQRLRRRFSTATIMTWTAMASAVLLLAASQALGEPLIPATLKGWGAVGGLAFVSQVAGQGLITYALAQLPASFSAVGLLIQPIYSTLVAWPTLGEAPVPLQVVGGLIVLAGIALARPRWSGPRRP